MRYQTIDSAYEKVNEELDEIERYFRSLTWADMEIHKEYLVGLRKHEKRRLRLLRKVLNRLIKLQRQKGWVPT